MFSRIFSGEANYGYCASKEETYYGFKGNLLINSEGVITSITATQAYVEESEKFLNWLKSTRRLVETVIGQLTDRFNIEKVRARKLWYLTNCIARKILTLHVHILQMNGESYRLNQSKRGELSNGQKS